MDDLLFVRYRSGTTLDLGEFHGEGHYVTTIRGKLYAFDDSENEVTVGRIRAWKIHYDLIEGEDQDPWNIMDAEHGALEALYSAIFDRRTGELKPSVASSARLDVPPAHILALHTVEIEEPYRGRKLSALLVSRTMEVFGGRDDLATLYPCPLEMGSEEGHQVKRAQRKLSMYWQSNGFKPIPGSDWLVCNAGLRVPWEPDRSQ